MSISPDQSIVALGFSARTLNVLCENNIFTFGDLLKAEESGVDFLSMRGLGAKCYSEIRSCLDNSNNYSDELAKPKAYSFGDYWKYIQTDDRNFTVLVDYYNSSPSVTLQSIGEKYGVTRERIRQIIKKGVTRLASAANNGLIAPGVVKHYDDAARSVTEISLLDQSDEVFTSSGLAYLMLDVFPRRYKLIKRTGLNGAWFTLAEENISEKLDVVLDELRYNPKPLMMKNIINIFGIPESMVMSIDKVIEKDGYVTLRSNGTASGTSRDVIITDYLNTINRPASVAEIANNTPLADSQVRGAVQDKTRFVNVGKSVYDLADKDYSNFPVSSLAKNILLAEDRALKIDEITKYVQRYSDISESGIAYNLIYTDGIRRVGNYFLLAEWNDDKIAKKAKKNYAVALDDAIVNIINSAPNEVFDFTRVKESLIEKYGDDVSVNDNSIRLRLSQLTKANLIQRVGNNTGCYTAADSLPGGPSRDDDPSTIIAKRSLNTFVNAHIGSSIQIRYQSKRQNSAKRWRTISIRGQDARYIYTNDLNNYGYRVKYVKEHVVEYRDIDQESETKPKTEPKPSATIDNVESSWYDDVLSCVQQLGSTFALLQLYGFEEQLSKKHPNNNNVKAKIRQQIQVMRDNNVITMVIPGIYRKNELRSTTTYTGRCDPKYIMATGKSYSNNDLMSIFHVSGQGGMRRSRKTNSLVLIAKHRPDNPYDDKWDGDILNYTGMGLRGAQSINYMQNKTLAESGTNGVNVYLFESYRDNEYVYRGLVELAGKPFYVPEKDEDGTVRTVLKFPIRLKED